jgi:hypothetical protein
MPDCAQADAVGFGGVLCDNARTVLSCLAKAQALSETDHSQDTRGEQRPPDLRDPRRCTAGSSRVELGGAHVKYLGPQRHRSQPAIETTARTFRSAKHEAADSAGPRAAASRGRAKYRFHCEPVSVRPRTSASGCRVSKSARARKERTASVSCAIIRSRSR